MRLRREKIKRSGSWVKWNERTVSNKVISLRIGTTKSKVKGNSTHFLVAIEFGECGISKLSRTSFRLDWGQWNLKLCDKMRTYFWLRNVFRSFTNSIKSWVKRWITNEIQWSFVELFGSFFRQNFKRTQLSWLIQWRAGCDKSRALQNEVYRGSYQNTSLVAVYLVTIFIWCSILRLFNLWRGTANWFLMTALIRFIKNVIKA